MSKEIINRVATSGLITINLEDYYTPGKRMQFDLKDHLFQGLILKEKDFRDFVKNEEWMKYQDALVAITCSADAIVPTWAFMLVAAAMQPFAKKIIYGGEEVLETCLYMEKLADINYEQYRDARIVIKGCSNIPVPNAAFVELMSRLRPFAKSIMYGEPCSTVPLYKR